MHKITSLEDVERKNLKPKFGSLGTNLGYLGPASRQDIILGFPRWPILVIWGPYNYPILAAPQAHAKNLKTVGAWCG